MQRELVWKVSGRQDEMEHKLQTEQAVPASTAVKEKPSEI